MGRTRGPVKEASYKLSAWVYRWWLRGGKALFKPDGTPTNKGLARGAEETCVKLHAERVKERERKRRLK
jgi:hypothetical protein